LLAGVRALAVNREAQFPMESGGVSMSKPLRLGLIGAGRVVEKFHLRPLLRIPNWSIVAAADPSAARRSWIVGKVPGITLFEGPEEMLDHVLLDAVLVATPPAAHAEAAQLALHSGVHVLLEKPGASDVEEATSILRASGQSGKILALGLNRRFMSNYIALRDHLRALGGPITFEGEAQLCVDPVAWGAYSGHMGDPDAFGGVLHDVIPHQLDALAWLLGSQPRTLEVLGWQRDAAGERLRYRADFGPAGRITCLAQHGGNYVERFDLAMAGQRFILYPTGIHRARGDTSRHAARLARVRHRLERILIRFGLKEDVMATSFFSEWRAFARAVLGTSETTEVAGPLELLWLHNGMQALERSRQRGEPVAIEG
jgi:predicted dehydrogenase